MTMSPQNLSLSLEIMILKSKPVQIARQGTVKIQDAMFMFFQISHYS